MVKPAPVAPLPLGTVDRRETDLIPSSRTAEESISGILGHVDGASAAKRETYAVFLACRDPRVPWYGRLLAACVVRYAFSPIDLIPDFVPVFGYLDDLILIPLGIAFVLRAIPPEVMAACREKAAIAMAGGKPKNWIAAGIIVAIWIALAALAVWLTMRAFR